MKKGFAFLFLSILLVSCTVNQITMDHIKNVEKGYSKEQLAELLIPKKPLHEFFITNNEQDFFIQIYNMVVRVETSQISNQSSGKTASVSYQFNFSPPPPPVFNQHHHNVRHSVTYTDPYAFIFVDNTLFYWGFFEELNKSEEDTITALAPLIQAEYDRLEEVRKSQL